MNKIINANINGFIFNIDEIAYDKLRQYLDSMHSKVQNAEVMTDIENRIAELFDYKLKNGSQAILNKDVEDIMQQIGQPEQFAQEEQEEPKKQTESAREQAQNRRKYRRLYRNEDDKMIGGVCSGIAAYFDLDPMIVRILFAISFFVFGTGFLLYLFLMVVVPKALTPSEKLEMMGEPVDFNNLGKTIEKDIKDAYDRYKPGVKTGFERVIEVMVKIGGIVLFVFILSIIIPTAFGLFTSIGVISWFLPVLSSYMFLTETQAFIILIGALLFVLIPLASLTFKIIQFLFKTKPMNKGIAISLSVFWFIGFCMLAYSTYNIGSQFSNTTSLSDNDTLSLVKNKTLIIKTRNTDKDMEFEFHSNGVNYSHFQSEDDLKEFLDDKIGRNVELQITRAYGSQVEMSVIKRACGDTKSNSFETAKRIKYHFDMSDSTIILDDYFTIGEPHLWRNQKVKVIIAVPQNQKFIIDRSCDGLFDDSNRRKIDKDELDINDNSIYNKQFKLNEKGVFQAD